MQAKINYLIIGVRDLARAIAFYRDTIGFALVRSDPAFQYAEFDAGGFSFRIVVGHQSPLAGERSTGVGVGVVDLDAAYLELSAKGVAFPMTPAKQPWGGYMAQFADSEGNVLYLDQIA